MAKINPIKKNGKDVYELPGSRHSELEGIDIKKYEVFTADDKLEDARRDFPEDKKYHWFTSFLIRKVSENNDPTIDAYTIKFDKPDGIEKLYYYLKGTIYEIPFEDTGDKKLRATLTVDDPPVGYYP